MRTIILLLFISLLISCSEERCYSCIVIAESNENEINAECNGLPNNGPDSFTEIGRTNPEVVCGSENRRLFEIEANGLESFPNQDCPPITAVTRSECIPMR